MLPQTAYLNYEKFQDKLDNIGIDWSNEQARADIMQVGHVVVSLVMTEALPDWLRSPLCMHIGNREIGKQRLSECAQELEVLGTSKDPEGIAMLCKRLREREQVHFQLALVMPTDIPRLLSAPTACPNFALHLLLATPFSLTTSTLKHSMVVYTFSSATLGTPRYVQEVYAKVNNLGADCKFPNASKKRGREQDLREEIAMFKEDSLLLLQGVSNSAQT